VSRGGTGVAAVITANDSPPPRHHNSQSIRADSEATPVHAHVVLVHSLTRVPSRIVTAVVAAIQPASVFRLPPPPFSRPSVWSSSHSATSFVYSCRHGWRTGVAGPGAQSFISISISARASAIPLTPPPIRLFRLRRLVTIHIERTDCF